MAQRRSVTAEVPEANYLVGSTDGPGPYYRLLMRCFYERYRSHVSYFFDRREQLRSLLHSLARAWRALLLGPVFWRGDDLEAFAALEARGRKRSTGTWRRPWAGSWSGAHQLASASPGGARGTGGCEPRAA